MSVEATFSDRFRDRPDQLIDVGGASVAYRRMGEGPDVLFVHGWPVSGATFRKILPHLVGHATCHVIDLPGAGSSVFDESSALSLRKHIESVRRVVDWLGVEEIVVVGHDSGGMIARHAMAGDPRLRAMGLIDTELSEHNSWKFRSFVALRHLPGLGSALGWVAGRPRLSRSPLVFGDAFCDRSLLGGEFDEFFLEPLRRSPAHRRAASSLLKSYQPSFVSELRGLHRRMEVPVALVWGKHDRFFPVGRAAAMVEEFPEAHLEVIEGAGLFAHEERPEQVARAIGSLIGA
jgi:pimeloyl-ACP methyl ester carboxylesterase